ncbi:MAG TPA: patatin-like protein [Polyangiaceae bacterium]|nr:patatin-like protein [Polyangiaceae bacterium]
MAGSMASEAEPGQGESERTKSREVRLGLVMYGGVSLAIYINGVASELFRAVRGRGTYRLLKALTDSDIVVDVLSGSSAGGINGILLSYALCNECEFASAAKLWRERGDIGGLMRGLDDPIGSYQSLLDSEHKYEPWLHEAFDDMGADPVKHDQPEDVSACPELDLFVTGTDFYGRKCTTVDDRNAEIQLKEHRTVFWLKHRKGRKEPFARSSGSADEPRPGGTPTTHAALARLARITSCFPAAFAPVTVGTTDPVDRRLRRWGDLADDTPRVFIDGGVLDNKPFTTTIDAIYNRHSLRPVSRWLFYVEPDPERFAPDSPSPESPSVLGTALASLTALPAYESIAADLERLRRHNDQVERVAALRKAVIRQAAQAPANVTDAEYRRLKLLGIGERLFAWLFTREARNPSPRRDDPDYDPALARRLTLQGQLLLREWFQKNVVASGGATEYLAPDVLFRLRRLFHLCYAHRPALEKAPAVYEELVLQIQRLEIARDAMERAVRNVAARAFAPLGAKGNSASLDKAWAERVWGEVWDALRAIARVPFGAEAPDLAELKERLANPPGDGPPVLFVESDAYERSLVAKNPADRPWPVAAAYADFERIDKNLYPIEAVAGLKAQDLVRVARVSPLDSQLGFARKPMERKVTGLRFGHFAAFFKRAWRSNDILWGQLDGASELLETLLEPKRVGDLFVGPRREPHQPPPSEKPKSHGESDQDEMPEPEAREQARVRLNAVVASMEADRTALPLPDAERKALFSWLRRLGAAEPRTRELALAELEHSAKAPNEHGGPVSWLVRACQLEILPSALRAVFLDAEAEALEQSSPTGGVTNATQASTQATQALTTIQKDPGIVAFFQNDYRVGEEELKDLPPLLVVERLTRMLIVAQKALLAGAGAGASIVRSHPLYKLFLGYPPRIIAAVVSMLGGTARGLRLFALGSVAYIVLSALVLVCFGVPAGQANRATLARAAFIGLPLALAFALWLVARLQGAGGWLFGLLRVATGVVAVGFLAACVPIIARVRHYDAALPDLGLPWLKLLRDPAQPILELVVAASAVLGLLWMLGVLGWVEWRVRGVFVQVARVLRGRPRKTARE